MSSDSTASEVTYMSISSHGDPLAWAVDLFGLQELESPVAAPASPDYVPRPEVPVQAPPSSDYVPGPEYPGYLAPADDEIIYEDQPHANYASPIALSPGYVADLDPKEDSKDGLVDYLTDGGNDDNDNDSFDDDEEEEEASDEEEEYLASADSVVAPAVDPIPSSKEIEPFKTDESATIPPPPPPADHTTPLGAKISIRPQASMTFPSEAEVERLLALPTPPPSPLISLSPPSAEERLARCLAAPALPSLPLPRVPHPYGSPNYVCAPRGFRAVMGRLRASSPSTHHPLHPSPPLPPLPSLLYLPPPVPTSLPLPSPPLTTSLLMPPPVDHREDSPEAELPPRKRLCLTVDPIEAVQEVAPTTLEGVNARVTELAERVDILIEDREFYQETLLSMEQEALVSREAWAQSVGLSSAVHHELQAYKTHTQIQDYRIALKESLTATLRTSAAAVRAASSAARAASAAARAIAAAAAATPITTAAVEQLIEARVSEALANHETL
ncbi:hypothetical protein Tco_1179607 [Tanacetum coccineum]